MANELERLEAEVQKLGYRLVKDEPHPDDPHLQSLEEQITRLLTPCIDPRAPYAVVLIQSLAGLVYHRAPERVQEVIKKAYGALWRDFTVSDYASRARRELLSILPMMEQGDAVLWALDEFKNPKPTHQETPPRLAATVSGDPSFDLKCARAQDMWDAMTDNEKRAMLDVIGKEMQWRKNMYGVPSGETCPHCKGIVPKSGLCHCYAVVD